MTLVKTKHRAPAHYKKISADHHHKSQKYVKTYWPYIPIVLVLGGAFVANIYIPSSAKVVGSSTYNTRAGAILGSNSAALLDLLYGALVILAAWYIIRHFKRIKSLVFESEQYLAKHYFLDIATAVVIGGLYVVVH